MEACDGFHDGWADGEGSKSRPEYWVDKYSPDMELNFH